ncbi:transcriptional regulator [Companilactobacillus tucceti DSM 20183]|uniref:Transcriptional regulator n=1 Tax=Companilactobacillus tucceti DSM 20183 TaxID=1423811 RepID=A0A0R1J7K4_9LACO|nr:TetR/AcrR family transcriptional regulator [Companilactobacillus tucceti]KRK63618.1 transcriptional regulator [Companilactobacillus tucceti DSM 20183]
MVSTTFDNLDDAKKIRVTDALLNEFSNHTLMESQVSRIVKESGIARGAFYKYFDDLKDAYTYTYGLAMKDIHKSIRISHVTTPSELVEQTRQFVEKTNDSRYYALIKMHVLHNESSFISKFDKNVVNENEFQWASSVMVHETIKQIMLNPDVKEILLKKLSNILSVLEKEDK